MRKCSYPVFLFKGLGAKGKDRNGSGKTRNDKDGNGVFISRLNILRYLLFI